MSLEGNAITEYASLSGKIHTLVIDKTLSISGACADAKVVGDKIEPLESCVEEAKELYEEAISGMDEVAKEIAETAAREAVEKLTAEDLNAYEKQEVLTDTTKAKFGLGTDAVPDDVLSWLGDYNQHCWVRRKMDASVTKGNRITKDDANLDSLILATNSGSTATYSIEYADEVSVNDDLSISLVNPKTLSLSHSTYTNANALKGKYVKRVIYYGGNRPEYGHGEIIFVPADSANASNGGGNVVYFNNTLGGSAWIVAMDVQELSASIQRGEEERIFSENPDEYPKGGVADGFEYEYLGVPFDNATQVHTKIATGSYTGTGTNGSTNPNSLTFDFAPKMVAIAVNTSSNNLTASLVIVLPKADGGVSPQKGGTRSVSAYEYTKYVYSYASTDGKTVYWWSPDGWAHQMNQSGSTYDYFAIG